MGEIWAMKVCQICLGTVEREHTMCIHCAQLSEPSQQLVKILVRTFNPVYRRQLIPALRMQSEQIIAALYRGGGERIDENN